MTTPGGSRVRRDCRSRRWEDPQIQKLNAHVLLALTLAFAAACGPSIELSIDGPPATTVAGWTHAWTSADVTSPPTQAQLAPFDPDAELEARNRGQVLWLHAILPVGGWQRPALFVP